MPNRILRDWTDSFKVDQLDAPAERFFTRLIMKVDDYGRFTANERLLRSYLFPLRTDIRDTDISRWLTACEKAGLIAVYNVACKEYLQITDFKQTLRQKTEKYPPPEAGSKMLRTCNASATQLDSECDAIAALKPETETEVETEISLARKIAQSDRFSFQDFWDLYGKKIDRPKCERKWSRLKTTERESAMRALPEYVAATPDVQFRKNPLTWLNGQCWQDEIIKPIKNQRDGATKKATGGGSMFNPNSANYVG